MENNFHPGQNDPTTVFLQTGAKPLDELLRDSAVPRGGALYLDFAPNGWPVTFLLALGQAALSRGERVVFLYVPTLAHMGHGPEKDADLCAGRALTFGFAEGLETFGLAPFFNAQSPADPTAALRYLVAGTFDEFEEVLDSLLSDPAGAPDQVLVYGLEQLFQNVRLFYATEGSDDVPLIRAESARLRAWLQEVSPRLEKAGTALWLSRSADSYSVGAGTLFTRGLRPLLQFHCPLTLLVEEALTSRDCPQLPSGTGGLPVTLFRRDDALGETVVEVLLDEDGFQGSFVEGDPARADFLEAVG